MPNIRQYESQAVLKPDDMAEQAAAQGAYHAEREAEIVPHLWEHGVDQLQAGYEKMQDVQAQAQTSAMMSDMSALTVSAHQNLTSALENGDTSSSVNPLEAYHDQLQQQLQAVGDKYDNPKTKLAFNRMADELTSNLLDRGQSEWHDKVRADTQTNLQQVGSNFANTAALDPASVDFIAKQSDSAVAAMRAAHPDAIGQPDADKMSRANRQAIYNSAGLQIANKLIANPGASLSDIDKTMTILSGDNFRNNMNPQDYNRVLDDVRKAYTTRQDAAAIVLKDQMPSMLNQVEKFGDPDGRVAKFIAALPARTPEQLAALTEMGVKYNDSQQAYQVRKVIGDLPQDQVQAYITQQKAAYQSETDPMKVSQARTAYDTAVKVAAKRDEEFHKDPTQYELDNNDTVGALYLKYQQNPTPQAFQTYAAFSASQQQKLYPGSVPAVLTPDMKRNIAGQFASVDQTPAGALNAAKMLSDLKTTTGQFYTGAIHELQKDHIISPAQYVAGNLINRPESQMLAQEVLQAAAVPKDALDKTSPLDESRALAVARNAFAPLAATMKGTVNGDELLNSYISATADVLRQRAVSAGQQYIGTRSGGQNDVSFSGPIAADATALANQMVLGRYSIKSGMRIPGSLDAGDVVGGAQAVLGDLTNHKLIASPYYGGLINGGEQFAKDIQSDGYWVTNPKGDGATLYFQGAPVQEHDGKGVVRTISIPFDQMQTLGRQSRGVLDKAGRFFTNPGSL